MLDMIPAQLLILVGLWLCNIVHSQEILVRKLEGSNRAYREEADTQVTTFNVSSGSICALICLEEICDAYNYHVLEGHCETFPNLLEGISILADATGWQLWVTEIIECVSASCTDSSSDCAGSTAGTYECLCQPSYIDGSVVCSSLKWRQAEGFNRITSDTEASILTFPAKHPKFCGYICLMDELCNGFNYHEIDEACEIITYALHNMQLQTQENATGWRLWLPADCPRALSSRSSFTSKNVAMVISGEPILSDIYCHVESEDSSLSYLSLYHNNQAYSDSPQFKGSVYAKYRLDIPELKILYDANLPEVVQFATLKQGYTEHNYVAYADNCVYTTGVSFASYTFDIRGTMFELTDDLTANEVGGHEAVLGTSSTFNSQYAYAEITGSCAVVKIGNSAGDLTIKVKPA